MSLRVLVIEPTGQLRGSERALIDLIASTKSIEFAVCCPPETPLIAELNRRLVKVFPSFIADLHRKPRWHRIQAAFCVMRACHSFKPDVLHVNQTGAYRVASAAARDSSVRLLVAGDGPSRDALTRAVHDWSMADRIRLPGIRQDMGVLMRAADVLLFPSAQEGLGMAAVEAQAAGLPVLASTAVPREAIVISSVYEALPLSASLETWADRLLEIAARPRPDRAACRTALETSEFSISRSSARLQALYRGDA